MKYIKHYNESKTIVQKKIELLQLISIDLVDMGFIINIDSKKRIFRNNEFTGKFIGMNIYDENSICDKNINLSDTPIIKDFILKLSDIEMRPRSISSGKGFVYMLFDKHGSMTKSSFLSD